MLSLEVVSVIQIIRMNLSQTLPLPRLSHRMPCCLTSVPVGNTYTTYAAKCFALTAYIQFINVNHCPLKWDGLFCLHPAFLHYSKTSNNGPSEKRTTSLQRTAHLPPIDFTIELINFEPPRSGHLSTPNNGH